MTELEKITINGNDFLIGPANAHDQVVVFAREESDLMPAFDRIGHVEHVGGEFPYKTRMNKERVQMGIKMEGKWSLGY
jgi:hypothetical protein